MNKKFPMSIYHPGFEKNIKERQKQNLNLLIKLDKICRENNLFYSIAYGTALGAVREGKIISWDPDIDIIIDQKTYDFLLKNYPNNIMNNNYKYHMHQFPRFIEENSANPYNPNASFLDLFVLLPSTKNKVKKYFYSSWNKAEAFRCFLDNKHFFKYKFMWWTLLIFGWIGLFWVPKLTIKKAFEKMIEIEHPDCYGVTGWPNKRLTVIEHSIFDLNLIDNGTKDIMLNGHQFRVLKDIEKYLVIWYGDNWKTPIKYDNCVFYGYNEEYKK